MSIIDTALSKYFSVPTMKQPLRFGQFCLNKFDQLPRPWPELFYEPETINAITMIREWEAEHDV